MGRGRRSYGQHCPVARSLDLLGERWTLLIVRELLVGPLRYSDLLHRLPGMWSNLLAPRLRALEAAGLVTKAELAPPAARTVYALTERGRALEPVIADLARFGFALLDDADDPGDELAPQAHLAPLGLKALVRLEALPAEPADVVLELDLGTWTVHVAGPRNADGRLRPLLDRVQVTSGNDAPDDAPVIRTTIATLTGVAGGRLSAEQARASIDTSPERSERAVASAEALFGLRD